MKIIADVCCNHLEKRLIPEMIKLASENGIDIVKFQLFDADKLNKKFPDYISNKLYYKKNQIYNEDIKFIFKECLKYDIAPLCTLFDPDREKPIFHWGAKVVKIGSAEAHRKEWVLDLCTRFETVFVSCGLIGYKLINEYRKIPQIKLFYCISKYPLKSSEIDFERMKQFDGFSDHTQDISSSKKALELGMEFIERHYTLGKFLPGKDHKISSTPDEFLELSQHKNYIEGKENFKKRWYF